MISRGHSNGFPSIKTRSLLDLYRRCNICGVWRVGTARLMLRCDRDCRTTRGSGQLAVVRSSPGGPSLRHATDADLVGALASSASVGLPPARLGSSPIARLTPPSRRLPPSRPVVRSRADHHCRCPLAPRAGAGRAGGCVGVALGRDRSRRVGRRWRHIGLRGQDRLGRGTAAGQGQAARYRCPELAQRSGWAAREALRELTRNTELRVDCYKRDPRGRAVCRARTTAPFGAEDSDIELALLRLGLAWHYVDYAAEQSPDERARYAQAEVDARAARRGLWAGQTPMPPWQCRERLRSGKLCD